MANEEEIEELVKFEQDLSAAEREEEKIQRSNLAYVRAQATALGDVALRMLIEQEEALVKVAQAQLDRSRNIARSLELASEVRARTVFLKVLRAHAEK